MQQMHRLVDMTVQFFNNGFDDILSVPAERFEDKAWVEDIINTYVLPHKMREQGQKVDVAPMTVANIYYLFAEEKMIGQVALNRRAIHYAIID